jgi:hypothetical protein
VPPIHVSIEDGRWRKTFQGQHGPKTFEFEHADGTVETLTIQTRALAYIHTVKRTVVPEKPNPAEA